MGKVNTLPPHLSLVPPSSQAPERSEAGLFSLLYFAHLNSKVSLKIPTVLTTLLPLLVSSCQVSSIFFLQNIFGFLLTHVVATQEVKRARAIINIVLHHYMLGRRMLDKSAQYALLSKQLSINSHTAEARVPRTVQPNKLFV